MEGCVKKEIITLKMSRRGELLARITKYTRLGAKPYKTHGASDDDDELERECEWMRAQHVASMLARISHLHQRGIPLTIKVTWRDSEEAISAALQLMEQHAQFLALVGGFCVLAKAYLQEEELKRQQQDP